IKNMGWTTLPAFIISFILFAILSPEISAADITSMEVFKQGLLETGLVHWYAAVIPIAVLVVFSLLKAPALLALAAVTISAIIGSFFHTNYPLEDLLGILFERITSNTVVEDIDELLTRGGMESMFFTIGIVLLALSLGGLLFTLGNVPKLL